MRPTKNAWLRLTVLSVLVIGSVPPPVLGRGRLSLDDRARLLRAQMQRRGESKGEIALALAWHYAKANSPRGTIYFVRQARKLGILATRTDLLLGTFYRQRGRHDAAFSTLVRLLVKHPEQPYALVQLWKTLYEANLQGAKIQTDTGAIRERLAALGLHFPKTFSADKLSANRSKRLAANGYNALLAGRDRFAAELFEAAIDAFPSNPLAHRGLGIARARQNDYTRAAGAYLLYLELNPQAPDAEEVDRVLMEYWMHRAGSGG